ncbi:MAG TPA: DUF4350 domain-containing protein [Stellaceae bacterium]|nr:DUF4350 domain-containing protein [Stellaceae bacterium]
MTDFALFSRRLLIAWIGAALLTFAAALYFMGGGGQKTGGDAVGPSSFSRSAIGYAGIAEILRRLGIPVVKSRYDALAKLTPGGVLVIAEPPPTLFSTETKEALAKARAALLILPKWLGEESATHPGWLADARLAPVEAATSVLRLAAPGAEVLRKDAVADWPVDRLGATPSLDGPVQLVRSQKLRPVVGNDDGMLVGEISETGRRLFVLADPDALANHGIARGDNAVFALALIEALRAGGNGTGNVVFDETVHGYVARPASPAKLLFQFPFVVATAQAALAILLLLWATLGRFGAPEPAPPPLDPGKAGLIHNAAALIDYAGHRPVMVRRYVEGALREAALQLHAPREIEDGALIEWLRQVGKARGVSVDCAEIAAESARRSDDDGLAACARAIHQWRGEIIDGPSGDPHARRRASARGEEGRRRAG